MFSVGQPVVCVDTSGWGTFKYQQWKYPRAGSLYTVRQTLTDPTGLNCIRLNEIRNPKAPNRTLKIVAEPFFRASRFRPIIERETDISIFQRMLIPNDRELIDSHSPHDDIPVSAEIGTDPCRVPITSPLMTDARGVRSAFSMEANAR